MTRHTIEPASFGLGAPAQGEQAPPRPDRGRIALRATLALALLLALAAPMARRWPIPAAPLRAALAWLDRPPIALALALAVLGGAAALALELACCAAWLAIERRRLDRAGHDYLRIRTLRPQSRTRAQPPADAAALWRGMHAALQSPASGRPAPWVALTLHARPDEPAALGAMIAGGAGMRRSLAHALTAALLAHDPEAVIDKADDPLAGALRHGGILCWQELALTRPPHFPLRAADEFAHDPLGALAAALRLPSSVEYAEIQLILRPRHEPAHAPWRILARRRTAALRRAPSTATEAQALEQKLAGECFDISVRLVALAHDRASLGAAHEVLRQLRAALGQIEARDASGTQRFRAAGLPATHRVAAPLAKAPARVLSRTPRVSPPPQLLLPLPLWAGPLILGAAEAACLWRLPGPELKTLIDWLPNRRLPAQPHHFIPPGASDRLVLGYAQRADGSLAPVGPPLRALRQVLHLTAGMGAGKSRALANFARQLVPKGFLLLDGKGDDMAGSLAATALRYVPLEDERRLVLVDVLDAEWPVGLNPLAGIDMAAAGGTTQALGMVTAVLARLDPETWGKSQGMQQYAQMAAALIAETVPEPTLASLKQALQDDHYRAGLLRRCANIEVKTFWEETFPRTGEQQKSSRDALLRRLDNLMVDETTRYLVAQPRPTLDLLECIERGRIVVLPLPHRTLGGMAEFVGMLLLQAVLRAAFRRPGDDQSRATVPLIVDELQVFLGQGDARDLRDAITQLRGFGIGGIYAHQTLAQLGDLRDEMLTNSANRMILRTLEPDASTYAQLFPAADLTPADISGQPAAEHQYTVFAGGDGSPEPCSIRPLPWPAPLDPDRGLPEYHGPDWQSVLPAPAAGYLPEECAPGAATLEALIAQLIYRPAAHARATEGLARLPDAEWAYLGARWEAIRAHQREYILAHPGCIALDTRIVDADPARQELLRREDRRRRRQQWLSRLETRTPRVLAAAAYRRQRW